MRLISLCLATSLFALSHAAHADTIQNFTLQNPTSSNPQYQFYGHMTVDTTTGAIQSFEVGTDLGQIDATEVLSASAMGTSRGGGGSGGATSFLAGPAVEAGTYFEIIARDPAQRGTVRLYLPVDSLVNYGGSSICSQMCTFSLPAPAPRYVVSGSFNGNFALEQATPPPTPVSATPEPASLYLLGPGLLGLAGLVRRHYA